jgi:mannose-1-phosphate guanylyltransferase
MLFRTKRPAQCGIATLGEDGRIVDFVEKPRQPEGNLANAGVYAVTADVYRQIADMNKSDLGFDVLPGFVGQMHGWIWPGYHRDIGTPEELERARHEALQVFGPTVG